MTNAEATAALDALKAAWDLNYGTATDCLQLCEASVVRSTVEDRYLRLSTGGWSANEQALDDFKRKQGFVWMFTWQLSAKGGLVIFRYPR